MAFPNRPIKALIANDEGATGAITALMMGVMLLMMGLVIDISYGYASRNQLQATADSSALAGALAVNAGAATMKTTAESIAAYNMPVTTYGTVLADADAVPGHWNAATRLFTPGGTLNAMQVTTRRASNNANALPSFFARLAGLNSFDVNTTSVAINNSRQYCILALGTSTGSAISLLSHGAPKADLSQCNIASNTSMRCTGHNLLAPYGDAHITDSGCGVIQNSGVPLVMDPFASLASNIPAHPCSTYAGENLSTSGDLGLHKVCGNLKLTANITLSGTDNVIVITDGSLNTNGHTIQTASGAAATIIFTGSNGSAQHTLTGGGSIDISAPRSGVWSGVAIYTDPALTNPAGLDMMDAGNSPSWNISGLVYMPHSSITWKGYIGKATTGLSCLVLVVNDLTIDGTGAMLNNGQCEDQGLTPPTGTPRSKLVA